MQRTNRGSRLRAIKWRLGAVLLAAAITSGGLAGPTATAAVDADLKAEIVDALRSAHEYGERSTAPGRAAAVEPEDCRTARHIHQYRYQNRFAGADRYETSVCASYWAWDEHDSPYRKAGAVVLARGDLYADALAGGPLAGYVNGPLLLTTPQSLLPIVKTEIQRLLAPGGTVYLLGSAGSLSPSVEAELVAAGYTTKRLGGADRYETAIRIAQAMPTTDQFFVTTGLDFPDGLAAGAFATAYTLGVTQDDDPATTKPFALLFTENDRMPANTRDFITARRTEHGGMTVFTAGGAAHTAVTRAFGDAATPFVGVDRYDTAGIIAERLYTDTDGKLIGYGVGLASGQNFPDGLSATTLMMRYSQPLLLTPSTTLDPVTRVFLRNHASDVRDPTSGRLDGVLAVFGSTGAVSESVVDAAITAYTP
ncbi:cell wall-binding repeat-containing protein [Actinokineospora soli]|uniref:Cell wall-binding repeat-containing protein n=1 Tax=Actinokineospora soli TaxID=1048753 RepID=A0ABW2TRF2_9PSEU